MSSGFGLSFLFIGYNVIGNCHLLSQLPNLGHIHMNNKL